MFETTVAVSSCLIIVGVEAGLLTECIPSIGSSNTDAALIRHPNPALPLLLAIEPR